MGKKEREYALFWSIAIVLMMLAICILSLQLIELHQERDLREAKTEHPISVAAPKVETEKKLEVVEEAARKPAELTDPKPDLRPHPMLSRRLRTPETIKEYNRVLYDVPHDEQCGFWAVIRGLMPKNELIRFDDVLGLKYRSVEYAAKSEEEVSRQEIGRLFSKNEPFQASTLLYMTQAIGRDVIVSNADEGAGCDLYTPEGELFHYDSIDEIYKEAANEKTIWLHKINNKHWVVALHEEESEQNNEKESQLKQPEVYFLVNP
ncbi:MAG: hypothetical protein LBS71_02835 [Puniceicoccales bacterium]|jgi:hypothetical protein|nr:hypothetical protein [Puniceicoccales bacterium]